MSSDPLVSVVVPSYYRNDLLRSALDSVEDQTYSNIETIVVDDSGEAFAESTAAEYDVTYIAHEENKGSQGARNTALQEASGDYIQLLDDDDALHPEKIEKQIELLESSPDVGVAYCGINNRRGNDVLPTPRPDRSSLERALRIGWPTAVNTALFIDTDMMEKILPLQSRRSADDIGMKIELAQHTEFDFVNKVLVDIGGSEGNMSGNLGFVKDIEEMIEEYDYLYDEFPPEVRRAALCQAYEWRCYRTLNEQVWSASAIISILKANYYAEELEPKLFGSAFASLFGKPGIDFAAELYSKVSQ